MKTTKFSISNGTRAEMFYNNYYKAYQIDHFGSNGIQRVVLCNDRMMAVNSLRRLAKSWGNFTVTVEQ
jgi:hypothetical protein